MPPWMITMWTLLAVIILAQHTAQGATVSVTKCCPEGQVVGGDGQGCVGEGNMLSMYNERTRIIMLVEVYQVNNYHIFQPTHNPSGPR